MRLEPRFLTVSNSQIVPSKCKHCLIPINGGWVFECEDGGEMCIQCSDEEDNSNNIAW